MKNITETLLCMERIISISHEIIENPALDDILHSIVEVAAELVECEKAGILLSDSTGASLNFVAVTQRTDRLFDIPVPVDRSISGAAFTANRPLIVQDVANEPRYYPVVDQLLNYPIPRSVLAVPLTFRSAKIGVLQVVDKKHGPFEEADVDMLVMLAAQATITIQIARLYRQAQDEIFGRIQVEKELLRHQEHLEELVKERTVELQRLSTTDALTGLNNRGHLMTLGDRSMRQAYNDHQPFSAMMIDVDHFKKINETYSHATGDVVLKKLADALRAHSRPEDILGRYDGEEFVVLLPGTGLQAAYELANTLLQQVRELQIDSNQGPFGFTASIGVVEMDLHGRQSLDSLIDMTIKAIAAAKSAGRNQVFLGNLLAEVQRLAYVDALTGVLTLGYWTVLAQQAVQEAQRNHTPLSVIFVDGDYLKPINDNYGHAMGDEAVRRLSAILRQNTRATDLIGRYSGGGDEFIILLPHTTLDAASELAERLISKIRMIRIDTGKEQFDFRASIGVITMDPDGRQTLDDLIEKADQTTYVAKRAGRNQIYVNRDLPASLLQ